MPAGVCHWLVQLTTMFGQVRKSTHACVHVQAQASVHMRVHRSARSYSRVHVPYTSVCALTCMFVCAPTCFCITCIQWQASLQYMPIAYM